METSRNTGQDNILLQAEFINSVASSLAYENIGVIAYSTEAHFVTKPGQPSNFSQFAQTLRTFNYIMGCKSNLGKAMTKAKEEPELFTSSKSALIVAIIPALKSGDDATIPARELKDRNVTIIGVKLESVSYIPYSETFQIITQLDNLQVLLPRTFAGLKTVVSTTREQICQGLYLFQNNNFIRLP